LTAAVEGDPEDMAKRWQRGQWYAGHARWNEAAADFTIALHRGPSFGDLSWMSTAPVFAAGDRERYRRFRREILERFGKTQNPTTAERVAKACLLLPERAAEVEQACVLADLAATRGNNHNYALYFFFCKGLADYRRGNYRAAVERLDPLLPRLAFAEYLAAQGHLVLAMALHHQGDAKGARAHLDHGAKLLSAQFPTLEISPYHHDWMIAWLLHREARELIAGKKTEPKK
jgi:serine/threonine-protein kinase